MVDSGHWSPGHWTLDSGRWTVDNAAIANTRGPVSAAMVGRAELSVCLSGGTVTLQTGGLSVRISVTSCGLDWFSPGDRAAVARRAAAGSRGGAGGATGRARTVLSAGLFGWSGASLICSDTPAPPTGE